MKEEMVVGMSAPGPVGRWGAAPPQALLERMKDYGQEGAFALWDDLSPEDRELLVRDIEVSNNARWFDLGFHVPWERFGIPMPAVEPVPESSVSKVEDRSPEDKERWWKKGLKAISEGKLAVVLLAGGQGTRLGSSDPKGCFNIGLPSGKSLFQLQAERILCVQKLAAQSSESPSNTVPIHWYIMTSPFTDAATRKFFETRRYFGLDADQVAKAPDGNGGVYAALKSKKLMEDMAARGVKYVDCYGVDNALVRVADPTFLGYFIDKGVSSAAKVVRKAYPQENVGVFVQRGRGGPLSVVEYSEMDAAMTTEINQSTGRLRYCWSNICLHMFTLDFLNQVANSLEKDSVYHLAEKKIPSIHGFTTGLKLEQFIFDAFTYSPSTALFEVMREEEFAPVKNANGATYDTPDSAKLMLLRLHSRWVVAAGGFLTHSVPLYMTGNFSPSSYIQKLCRGLCRSFSTFLLCWRESGSNLPWANIPCAERDIVLVPVLVLCCSSVDHFKSLPNQRNIRNGHDSGDIHMHLQLRQLIAQNLQDVTLESGLKKPMPSRTWRKAACSK
ncbi:UDP-N-acetylglucosamine diphosphorylase 1 [Dichanthelium oligosanthes]|uniref:UDP-N-acetylglucosamine diphosphorylase n=1 Tax=Dichanthelium oligosanthes TaxID=888268 RepID=A0A1E5V6L7_9POAL|nr:UDP-N-acetylglucosamine diphosphorylase 1 [Dichanthelium oligosanthes]